MDKGFTLIELTLVVAIMAALIFLTLPIAIGFYKSQQLDTTADGVIQALRRAQLKAMSQADYSFGVYVGSGQTSQYSLFKGDSYEGKTDEEIFDISDSISFSGISEVIFTKLEGLPSESSMIGNIVLTGDSETETININALGRINLE